MPGVPGLRSQHTLQYSALPRPPLGGQFSVEQASVTVGRADTGVTPSSSGTNCCDMYPDPQAFSMRPSKHAPCTLCQLENCTTSCSALHPTTS